MSASGAVLAGRQRWSRERIVDAMRMFHEEHGYPPRAGDWKRALPTYPDPGTVSRHFGSWAQALQAAGFQVRRIDWSDERLLDAIRTWTREHGAPPKTTSWARRDPAGRWPTAATVQLRFGCWETALLAAGVRVDRTSWDRETVVAAIAAFAELHGRRPRSAELRKANDLPDNSTVVRYCGSLAQALAEAGCPAPQRHVWDRASILAALQRFADDQGRAPTWGDWKLSGPDHPYADAVAAAFGSWPEAIRAAGLRPARQPYDRDEVIEALRAWMLEHGRAPKPAEWRPDPARGVPTLSAIRRHFGKWDLAIRTAAEGLDLPGLPEEGRPVYQPAERWAPRGTWNRERVIEALEDWAREFGDAPLRQELSPAGAEWLASPHRERAQRWMQEHPRWPGGGAVSIYFDSWADALRAAGLPVRYTHEFDLPLAERVGAALRMDAAGHSTATIADELGVSQGSVYKYLRASMCPDCGAPVVTPTAKRCLACSARENVKPRFDRQETIALMRAWAQETGETPMTPEWLPTADQRTKWGSEYPRWPSNRTVVTHFGTWNAGLEAAGFGYRRRTWDRESVLDALRDVATELGRAPSRTDLAGRPGEWPTPQTLEFHFGTFHAGMAAAGFPVARRRSWSPEEIVACFQAFAAEHGHPPSSGDLSKASDGTRPSSAGVYRTFGTWRAALAAAGYSPRLQSWPPEDVIAALRRFARRHGRPPRVDELRSYSDPPLPAHSTIERRFGGFSQALSAAGLARTHGVRRTRRTEQLLDAVAAKPGSSNRALAAACAITDSSHISILLRRLHRLGLIKNTGPGAPAPNSWSITRSGAAARRRFACDARGEQT
jgi:hypothetical protein